MAEAQSQIPNASNPAVAFAAAVRAGDVAAAAVLLERHRALRATLNEALPGAPFGGIALTTAASRKDREMVDVLLSAGADIDAKSDWWAGGFSALDVADPDFATFLIERGATVTPYAAARLGMADVLERALLEDPGAVHSRGGDGQTPLHVAAGVAIADLLLNAGADIDALDVDHESTPAMYHVRDRTDVTRSLMRRGCKSDILMASAGGDLQRVREFLDRDPDSVRTTVSERWFPRRNARAGGTIYIWTLGANKSPHAIAIEFGNDEVYRLLMERTPPSLRLAISIEVGDDALVESTNREHSSLVPALTDDERAKLVAAAEANKTAVVVAMLRAGWPVDTRFGNGTTALHWAGFHGNAEMVKEILHYHPSLELVESAFGGTALGWALHGSLNGWHAGTGNYLAAVAALLDAGAQVPGPRGDRVVASEAVLALLRRRGAIKEP